LGWPHGCCCDKRCDERSDECCDEALASSPSLPAGKCAPTPPPPKRLPPDVDGVADAAADDDGATKEADRGVACWCCGVAKWESTVEGEAS